MDNGHNWTKREPAVPLLLAIKKLTTLISVVQTTAVGMKARIAPAFKCFPHSFVFPFSNTS